MEKTETIEERKERWAREEKEIKGKKAFMNILEDNAGLIYKNLEEPCKIEYGVEPNDVSRGKVTRNFPLYKVLFDIIFESDVDALVALRRFLNENEPINSNVNALSIINELVVIDNKINNGEHKEILRSYAKECRDRSLKGQVNIIEPASEALGGRRR